MSTFTRGEARELSSGLVIAGAYADKIRRTLFAQLKDLVKQDKEFAREVARATAELNVVLFNILVNELKIDKGDAVRVRVNYSVDPTTKRIVWDYDSLRVEAFKRIPDEHVARVIHETVKNKLTQILESYRAAPRVAEEAVRAFEITEEAIPPRAPAQPTPTPPPAPSLLDLVGSVDVLGETVDGGILVKLVSKDGQSLGLATITPSGEDVVIDAILIHGGASRRYVSRSSGKVDFYVDNPNKVIEELSKIAPTELSREQAETLIREKMQSLL